jgi:6-phosphogluconate dehydrogenase
MGTAGLGVMGRNMLLNMPDRLEPNVFVILGALKEAKWRKRYR